MVVSGSVVILTNAEDDNNQKMTLKRRLDPDDRCVQSRRGVDLWFCQPAHVCCAADHMTMTPPAGCFRPQQRPVSL